MSQIKFVLVRTSHPGNIGATARAIKNMGFSELTLVNPKYFPHDDATARASGAEDVLNNAQWVPDLQSAIADCNLVIGTSARTRAVPIPLLNPKEAAVTIATSVQQSSRVAVLFGQERTGLTNEELASCHYHVYIPCNPNFPSLNIAAAVQIIAYELFNVIEHDAISDQLAASQIVSVADMERFYQHLEETLIKLEFLNPQNPRQLMRKLRRLFNRVAIEQNEMNILRGILTAVIK